MRDLRDPQAVGETLLHIRRLDYSTGPHRMKFSTVYDLHAETLQCAPDYSANPSCIEKYGRPQDVQPRWQEIKVA